MKKIKKFDIIVFLILILIYVGFLLFIDSNKSDYGYLISIIEKSMIYAITALSMNMVIGYTGIFSLGQAGFMAIGAYITSIFIIPITSRDAVYYMNGINPILKNMILPIPIAIILGGVVAAIFAAIIGYPVLKLKSDYLAVATLGFAEIIKAVVASPTMDKITNGSYGLNKIPGFKGTLECFIYCLIPIVIMILLINSSYGRDFKAVREDEIAAQSVGINIFRTKQMSFIISSFFTGISGGLLAMFMRSINSSTFSITLTYDILLIVVLGGIGSITGSVVGSFIVNAGKELLRFFDEPLTIGNVDIGIFRPGLRMVVFSILLMVVVLFFRNGLMGKKEFVPSEILKFLKKKKGDK